MPWSLNESPLGWVEVTDKCNINCKGCYRRNREGHKPIEKLKEEVLFLKKWRNCDSIALAGGEPTLHPGILELAGFIRDNGMKTMLITNGYGLTEARLVELRNSGVTGLSFNINSTQERPEFKGVKMVSQSVLNKVRLKYAKMVAKAGGLTAAFKFTVNDENFDKIPDFVQWAIENSDIINSITLVALRGLPIGGRYEYYADGKKIDVKPGSLGYAISDDEQDKLTITSKDIYRKIKNHFPEYDANSYLGGTADHTSFKWVIGNIILNTRLKRFGCYGRKAMEVIQTFYHFFNGRYVLHLKKRNFGKKVFLLAFFDKKLRRALRRFLVYVLTNPLRLFYQINILNIAVLQPPEILPDGSCDMCEGCPDMCVYDGKLVPSCRLDEYIQYDTLLKAYPLSK